MGEKNVDKMLEEAMSKLKGMFNADLFGEVSCIQNRMQDDFMFVVAALSKLNATGEVNDIQMCEELLGLV